MTPSDVLELPLQDQKARERIREALDTNILVEAGAGSGKTTELVNRIVRLLVTGTATVEEVAVVTFTRKAAGELRERLQNELERRRGQALAQAREAAEGPDDDPGTTEAREVARRLDAAVDELDRAFVGTIHAFCARLLRERPLEVGLDPGFRELPAEEQVPYRRRFWEAWLERAVRDQDPLLGELSASGLQPAHLFGLFEHLVENPDVRFPTEDADPPSERTVARVRRELERLVERGRELMPDRPPAKGWDRTQRRLRTVAFQRDVTEWAEPADLFESLEEVTKPGPRGHQVTYNRWRDKALTKELQAELDAFSVGPDAPANQLLHRWYAHRYARALALAGKATKAFAKHRRRAGVVDFQDLLLLTARLLRQRPGVRRELGERYRRLLVDEFQDTDPLQAELMFLLASPPEETGEEEGSAPAGSSDQEPAETGSTEAGPHPGDWRRSVPRPGALFVVGDPKQSIYRFRRADIQLYEVVKRRFQEVGEVVELTTNFRSRPPVGDLVNQVFDASGFFPGEATLEQARFEPLNTRPVKEEAPEGIFRYDVGAGASNRGAVCDDDAARLASWIRRRMDSGERGAGDFMILTRTKRFLDAYARELEARGVPVQVTGAGIGITEELRELVAVLECMVDPGNPVKVLSALVGLFFGLDLERVLAHRLEGGELDAMRPGTRGDPEVRRALATLHRWFLAASRRPADVFVGELVAELGLLPYAAAGELGSIRAGALLFVLDSVRAAALAGDASLPGALDALERALEVTEAEAPLEPGRPDVVRLMNLHQAKGLEAPVVVLADPSGGGGGGTDLHVERDETGAAVGYLCVTEKRSGYGPDRILARPTTWEAKEAVEERFAAAEEVRLLYVAVTRAEDELVVARWVEKPERSVWHPLDDWLLTHAEALEMPVDEPEPRAELAPDPVGMEARAQELRARRDALREPSVRYVTVTDLAKSDDEEPPPPEGTGAPAEGTGGLGVGLPAEASFRGYSWGSVVHDALAAAAEEPDEPLFRAACRSFLVEYGRPLDDHGEPVELQELLELVRDVRRSELWTRARGADYMQAEVPFAAPGRAPSPSPEAPTPEPVETAEEGRRQLDLFGGAAPQHAKGGGPGDGSTVEASGADASGDDPGEGREDEAGEPLVLEGVIDLVFREPEGWVVADWKTDLGTDPDFPRRMAGYRRQVELYAEAWARLTGEPVKERVLYFTSQDRAVSW